MFFHSFFFFFFFFNRFPHIFHPLFILFFYSTNRKFQEERKCSNIPTFLLPPPMPKRSYHKNKEKNIIERIYDSLLKMVLKNFEIKKILFYSKCTGIKKYRDQRVNNVKLHQSRPIEFHFRDGNSFSSNSSNCLRSS